MMNRRNYRTRALAGLALVLGVAASAPAQIFCELGLDADKLSWDRLRSTGSAPATPTLCDGTAPDSLNDSLPFCAFKVRATTLSPQIMVQSLELAPIDFDPLVLVYCSDFSPTNPPLNLLAIDDDGLGYPDAALQFFPSAIGDTFDVVITSYSAFNGSEFGLFRVDLVGLELVGACACSIGSCAGDANADGVVDFADITDVLANWLNDYTPGTGPGDANGDGIVNFADTTQVLGTWLDVCP